MISHHAALLALRAQVVALSVVTTGSATLAATSTGYSRASGSFVTDGFTVGMEFTPAGFAVNAVHVITAVTATLISTADTIAVETASSGRSLAVGLPTLRAWENVAFTPTAGRWYVEEDYLPGPSAQETLGSRGQVEALPQYVLKLYGTAGHGPEALYAAADALLTAFAPRTGLTLSTGDTLQVRTNPAPFRSQLLAAPQGGWSVVTVTIPCRVRSANPI